MHNFRKSKRSLQSTSIVSETDEQIALIDWSNFNPILKEDLIHIANQRKCTMVYGNKLKRMGVKKGVSDLFLAHPMGKYHGLWIEMKSKEGKLSDYQFNFLVRMKKKGYQAAVCRTFEEAKEVLENYLKDGEIKC